MRPSREPAEGIGAPYGQKLLRAGRRGAKVITRYRIRDSRWRSSGKTGSIFPAAVGNNPCHQDRLPRR